MASASSTSALPESSSLRQRRTNPSLTDGNNPSTTNSSTTTTLKSKQTNSDDSTVVWGKTPSGQVFRVPTTHDVLTALFHPSHPKSHFDIANLILLATQLALFFFLPRNAAQVFFGFYFAFWRLAYDAGLGCVLTKQSKNRWMVKKVQKYGWLDASRNPITREWVKNQLVGKMGKDYSFDELPVEYNTWLLFRQLVDIILVNDFLAYCMFSFSCFRVPDDLSISVHILRWVGGIALILFNIWVKTEAHDVVKDYGWYWGDVFFQRGALVFDGVFELAPHPMYSVGYLGYYGLSLICGSYPVLFASLAAHAAQFGFLVLFENPHIERKYGQRKPIAKRSPIPSRAASLRSKSPTAVSASSTPLSSSTVSRAPTPPTTQVSTKLPPYESEPSTPSATEGDTATETDFDDVLGSPTRPFSAGRAQKMQKRAPNILSSQPLDASWSGPMLEPRKPMSQHDLMATYFRRDLVIWKDFDTLRATDQLFFLLTIYVVLLVVLPSLIPIPSRSTMLALHFVHSLIWVLIHIVGMGLILKEQSKNKFLVRHYMKNYHYRGAGGAEAVREAFGNWKVMWNGSMWMAYLSFAGLVWNTYSMPTIWSVGNELLRHTLGAVLVALHIWATLESYEVLGVFGWFFGDFFMDEFPANLDYTGIYRYLNNPDIMGSAAWFGMALICGNKLVLGIALVRHLAHAWFLSYVENPHMEKRYGDSLRKEAGFVKVIKNVVGSKKHVVDKHTPKELVRVVKEVTGGMEKVYEETVEAVDEFLKKSKPRLSGVVQDTKVLLQQSRERLVITQIAPNISQKDTDQYTISIPERESDIEQGRTLRFHFGEPIRVQWRAPKHHSRKDWIGIYRWGANKSPTVTRVASLGLWVPLHDEEWDGDIPVEVKRPDNQDEDSDWDEGVVTFKSSALPWTTGLYEIRYHHDGKYNVMASLGPIDIHLDKPSEITYSSVYTFLQKVVPLCLDSDPSLIPTSCKTSPPQLARSSSTSSTQTAIIAEDHEDEDTELDHMKDPDDFTFWSPRQAKRICCALKIAFDVEFVSEVVVADANIATLTKRIIGSKSVLEG